MWEPHEGKCAYLNLPAYLHSSVMVRKVSKTVVSRKSKPHYLWGASPHDM
jgi:hypothetical protein